MNVGKKFFVASMLLGVLFLGGILHLYAASMDILPLNGSVIGALPDDREEEQIYSLTVPQNGALTLRLQVPAAETGKAWKVTLYGTNGNALFDRVVKGEEGCVELTTV